MSTIFFFIQYNFAKKKKYYNHVDIFGKKTRKIRNVVALNKKQHHDKIALTLKLESVRQMHAFDFESVEQLRYGVKRVK